MANFKTRARAVDMLGRQQIAGIPNAISELFKNAYDAYAQNVIVDFYKSDRLFVLRDDGLGMTQDDFESRWLTLGTESKLISPKGLMPPPKDPFQVPRPIMGEKGIGRLAIAVIGSQVLILTRAKRFTEGSNTPIYHDLVAAYIHWGLFTSPGINIEDIEIPIQVFSGGTLPGKDDIFNMVNQVRCNTESLKDRIPSDIFMKIIEDLNKFTFDIEELDTWLEGISLKDVDGHGTHFIIFPADEMILADIEENENGEKASKLEKALLGFTNTMRPEKDRLPLNVNFRYHKTDDYYDDIIANGEFFTPEDFHTLDHYIEGTFDEYGQFEGKVTIYGEKEYHHIISWPAATGRSTECGPFKISFGYVMGERRISTMDPVDFSRMTKKLNKIGGLYIYKNGIRILPYGDTDFDWLDIETNRSKHAGYYFFAYRRIFGAIEINQEVNNKLVEKAGREGYQENKAYRQFRSILKNFFEQLAADFFRGEDAELDTFYEARKEELKRIEKVKQKKAKLINQRKKDFKEALNQAYTNLDQYAPHKEVQALIEKVIVDLESAKQIDDPDRAVAEFFKTEAYANKTFKELREKYKVSKPKGISLGVELTKDWGFYEKHYANLENELFTPAEKKLEELVGSTAKEAHLELDKRRRIQISLDEIAKDAKKKTRQGQAETRKIAKDVSTRVFKETQTAMYDIHEKINEIMNKFGQTDLSKLSDEEIVQKRIQMESEIFQLAMKKQEMLDAIKIMLEKVDWGWEDGRLITSLDLNESDDEELANLRDQVEQDLELSQLGLAVNIINHEFESSINSVRDNIRELKAWADVNESLQNVYSGIRHNFEHLDGYLTLFTPLNRRLYRTPQELKGSSVTKFVEDLFKERMRRYEIKLEVTSAFNNFKVTTYPSTFYPVFVNLVDNAIYWLGEKRNIQKIIQFDVENGNLIISDNGPGVPLGDRHKIFDIGVSKKVNGRGLGLHISRQVLNREGFDLILSDSKLGGATFKILPLEGEK